MLLGISSVRIGRGDIDSTDPFRPHYWPPCGANFAGGKPSHDYEYRSYRRHDFHLHGVALS